MPQDDQPGKGQEVAGMLPNELTGEKLEELKKQYGQDLFSTVVGGSIYYWRPLTRLEYKQIMKMTQQNPEMAQNPALVEDRIATTCMVHPRLGVEELSTSRAGVITAISNAIMEASGFGLESARSQQV